MLLDADVQAGLVVDRTGALRGRITVDDITALMREPDARPLDATARAAADAAAGEPGRGAEDAAETPATVRPPGRRRRGLTRGDPLGLDRRQRGRDPARPLAAHDPRDRAARRRVRDQPRARDLGGPQAGRLRPGHRGHRDPVHDPVPRRVRAARPDLRVLDAGRVHPADHVHAADPVPQHRRRVPGRPERGARGGRRHGLPAARAAAPRRAAARGAADDHRRPAGGRDADRPRDGRVDPRVLVRRARPAHHRGPPDVLPDEVRARRGACRCCWRWSSTSCSSASSGSRRRGPAPGPARWSSRERAHHLADHRRHLAGRDRDPVPAARAPRDLRGLGRRGDGDRAADRAVHRPHRPRRHRSRSTSPTSAAPSRRTR